ncbi:hypothetical protein NDU88_012884 [Pleurodeles waltl]|uniref:Uncharacterized protein n=1 Tax=Pleurodeles waltl TaxID=8319 RepID=A0AAV7R350_PLEWA|nr:hypothetical protein NDU88_012884 [Pleurodeles waltl]
MLQESSGDEKDAESAQVDVSNPALGPDTEGDTWCERRDLRKLSPSLAPGPDAAKDAGWERSDLRKLSLSLAPGRDADEDSDAGTQGMLGTLKMQAAAPAHGPDAARYTREVRGDARGIQMGCWELSGAGFPPGVLVLLL